MLLNIRGMGAGKKSRSLKVLIHIHKPNVILLQETMISQETSWEITLQIYLGWLVCASNSCGLSRGLAAA